MKLDDTILGQVDKYNKFEVNLTYEIKARVFPD